MTRLNGQVIEVKEFKWFGFMFSKHGRMEETPESDLQERKLLLSLEHLMKKTKTIAGLKKK